MASVFEENDYTSAGAGITFRDKLSPEGYVCV